MDSYNNPIIFVPYTIYIWCVWNNLIYMYMDPSLIDFYIRMMLLMLMLMYLCIAHCGSTASLIYYDGKKGKGKKEKLPLYFWGFGFL